MQLPPRGRGQQRAVRRRAHRAGVVELAAIVGRRKDGDELSVGEELVAILHHLVGAHHQVEVVLLEKSRDHIGAEGVRNAAVVLCPTRDVGVGVRPQQVAQQACRVGCQRDRASSGSGLRAPFEGGLQWMHELGMGPGAKAISPESGTSVGRMTLLIC